MGLIPTYIRQLILLHKGGGLEGPVLTLGNQDLWATHDELNDFFLDAGVRPGTVEPLPHESHLFRELPGAENYTHARTLFGMMGLEVLALDKFSAEGADILHDLNDPLPAELCERFGTVIDGGTLEHVFDVRRTMESLARACRVGGRVIHFTPSSNYLDHGLYSVSPCFFYDFYGANGFGEFECRVFLVDSRDLLKSCPFIEYSYGADLTKILDPRLVAVTYFTARKLRPTGELVIPTQGVYDGKGGVGGQAPGDWRMFLFGANLPRL